MRMKKIVYILAAAALFGGLAGCNRNEPEAPRSVRAAADDLPASYNACDHGLVTSVKNQKRAGSHPAGGPSLPGRE